MPIRPEDAFQVLDVVETDYSGKVTRHIVIERFRTRNCQSGVTYRVVPAVPKSGSKNSKIDHDWFKRVAKIVIDGSDAVSFFLDPR